MQWRLSNNLSVYLDFIRFGAALLVFVTHARNFLLPGVSLGPLPEGRDAVTVFFVLSGFVISYVAANKELDKQSYIVARVARILPVAVAAIVFTALIDRLGTAINPAYYASLPSLLSHFYAPASWPAALSYLTFTNQLWFSHIIFGSAEPYWSLGFEVQYYLFFFLFWYVRGRLRWPLVALWALFAGPKILMYLPIWLMGFAAARFIGARPLKSLWVACAFVAASVLLYLATTHEIQGASNMYRTWDLRTEAINFVYFTTIGAAVTLNLIGMERILRAVPDLSPAVGRAIRWVAGGSFTLYLMHQPVLVFLSALIQPVEQHRGLGAAMVVAALIICMALAEVAERRKAWFAAGLRAGLQRRLTANVVR